MTFFCIWLSKTTEASSKGGERGEGCLSNKGPVASHTVGEKVERLGFEPITLSKIQVSSPLLLPTTHFFSNAELGCGPPWPLGT